MWGHTCKPPERVMARAPSPSLPSRLSSVLRKAQGPSTHRWRVEAQSGEASPHIHTAGGWQSPAPSLPTLFPGQGLAPQIQHSLYSPQFLFLCPFLVSGTPSHLLLPPTQPPSLWWTRNFPGSLSPPRLRAGSLVATPHRSLLTFSPWETAGAGLPNEFTLLANTILGRGVRMEAREV